MTFIAEVFLSGCISKVINDVKDYSWAKIKSVINDKNDRNLSTRIYRVIEKALIKVADKKFKSTDILYEAIEKIFIDFRDHGDTLESVKCGLNVLGTDVSDQRCENFLERFYEGICQDDDLYKEVIMYLQQKGIKINLEEFQKINEKINNNHMELIEKINSVNKNLNGSSLVNEKNKITKKLQFQNNKKQDYIKIWNARLFLHVDNNENPITLADAFIMPDYQMYKKIFRNKFSINDTLDQIIKKFIKYDRTSNMLITGAPGMGKSSIIAWIANRYKDNGEIIILRFRDWDKEVLEKGFLKAICTVLQCKKDDLNNVTLILDGFDEIKSLKNRQKLLDDFFNEINDFNTKFIITSRPSYISSQNFDNAITILPFNIKRIEHFYEKITGVELINKKIYNTEVLGIPVILYMAIMSRIKIERKINRAELYGRIFAKKGGIFDKFCHEGIGYDRGAHVLRSSENIGKYLEFLRETAFRMFEKNETSLLIEECQIPQLEFQGESVSVLEFPIKHLFERGCRLIPIFRL